MFRGRSLALLTVLLAGGECSPGGRELRPFDCVLGVQDESGDLVLLADDDPVEMVLGFQGFLFVDLAAEGDAPDGIYVVGAQIDPEGMDPINSTAATEFEDGVARDMMVFLEASQLTELTDRPATITVRLESDRDVCVTSSHVVLIDADTCVHDSEEDPCEEAS